jgi:hypothetical protein
MLNQEQHKRHSQNLTREDIRKLDARHLEDTGVIKRLNEQIENLKIENGKLRYQMQIGIVIVLFFHLIMVTMI